jgi:hypothetical protein
MWSYIGIRAEILYTRLKNLPILRDSHADWLAGGRNLGPAIEL